MVEGTFEKMDRIENKAELVEYSGQEKEIPHMMWLSPIKYELSACTRLIVAYNNELWTSLKLNLQFYKNYLLHIITEVKGKWLHLK